MRSPHRSRAQSEPPAVLVQPCASAAMQWDIQQIQLGVARRAFELFQQRNGEHGHDWEDWFQAESELLRPVSIAISEKPDRFCIRANVLGFAENELKICVEPNYVTILGRKKIAADEPTNFYPDQILRVVALCAEIDPKGAVVELQSGVVKLDLPKAAKASAASAGSQSVRV